MWCAYAPAWFCKAPTQGPYSPTSFGRLGGDSTLVIRREQRKSIVPRSAMQHNIPEECKSHLFPCARPNFETDPGLPFFVLNLRHMDL